MYDEGWFLQSALRIIDGEKIYKDFDFLYNPGGLYVNVLAFNLLGKSILASRVFAFLNSLIALSVIIYLSKRLRSSIFFTGIAMLGYIFWGPGHINFIWPVMLCLTLALMNGALYVVISNKKKSKKLFFLTGVLSALVFICKQNFGLASFFANFFMFILVKDFRNRKYILLHAAGYISVIVLQLLLLVTQGVLDDYINSFYYFTVVKIFQQGILNSPYPWQYTVSPVILVLKMLLYLLPLIIAVIAFILLYTKKVSRGILFFPIITGLYYVLSIRPTTDYVHLAPLLAVSLVPLLLIFSYERDRWKKMIYGAVLIILCIVGGYTSYFSNYYRWNPPLRANTYFVNDNSVLLWTDKEQYDAINGITAYFDNHAKDEKYVFVTRFTPVFYMLLDKKNPTVYDYAEPSVIEKEKRLAILQRLREHEVKHIIVDIPLKTDKTAIGEYVQKNYVQSAQFSKYTIWKLKE